MNRIVVSQSLMIRGGHLKNEQVKGDIDELYLVVSQSKVTSL